MSVFTPIVRRHGEFSFMVVRGEDSGTGAMHLAHWYVNEVVLIGRQRITYASIGLEEPRLTHEEYIEQFLSPVNKTDHVKLQMRMCFSRKGPLSDDKMSYYRQFDDIFNMSALCYDNDGLKISIGGRPPTFYDPGDDGPLVFDIHSPEFPGTLRSIMFCL